MTIPFFNSTSTCLAKTNVPETRTETYGKSGLGMPLNVTYIGNGDKIMLMVFEVHGFEDHHKKDGQILVDTGKAVIDYFSKNTKELNGWTLAIVASANPDGLSKGTTNNGKGRCQISKGIDINRDFDYHFKQNNNSRNKTLAKPFGSPEAQALRDLVLKTKPKIVLDFHGWERTTYGDNELSQILKTELSLRYSGNQRGPGYFTSWASKYSTSVLVEYGYGNKKNTSGTILAIKKICNTNTAKAPNRELILEHELKIPNNIGTTNARRAAELVNGYVLKSGAEFSFNKVVGERTIKRGFVSGTLHARDKNGKEIVIRSVGSGVCRTSTALYQAAKKAGLKIVERHSHEFEQPYAKRGDDATVWYGVLDNRFQNTKNYSILIECSVTKDCIVIVKFYKLS